MTVYRSARKGFFLFLSFLLVLSNDVAFCQLPSRDLFNIIFENSFNDDQAGTYQASEFVNDWNAAAGSKPFGNVEIINDNDDHQKAMRAYYPSGTMEASDNHGFTWYSYLSTKMDEVYFSFDVRFKPGFQWVLGGKIPGLVGGSVTSGQLPAYNSGFSSRLVWKPGGRLFFYVYHHDQENIYGDIYEFDGFRFETGKWYNLTMRVVLNSVINGTAKADGILEGYVDGKLMFQKTGFRFRLNEGIKIERMYICSFFGGNTPDWVTTRDEWIDTDNYIAYTYADKALNVPRGFQLSSLTKWLLHPNLDISDTEWKSSFKSTLINKTSISLAWMDYPVPTVYTLERKEGEGTSFTSIASIPYGTKTYTDNNLKAGINYTYRLKAGNSAVEKTISTMNPLLPFAPSSVTITGQTKSTVNLKWTDNSNNETGFIIQRSISTTGGFNQVASLPVNSTTYTDVGLQPGTNYYYRLSAVNTDGSSEFSSVIPATTTPLQIPLSPSGLITSAIDYTEASILWKDNANNELGFELERSGPDNGTQKNIIALPANAVSFTDTGLVMNGTYLYRIRSKNDDGASAWSNQIEIVTPIMYPPATPTKLRSTKFTDKSVSVTWKDNSNNEDGFIINRALAADSVTCVSFSLNANDTLFTDSSLESSTTYQYTIIAVNRGGSSSLSNKNVATTLSSAELKRTKDGLIAYYNFGYSPDYVVYDQSGYEEPVNLRVLDRSAVQWDDNHSMNILSNTALVSMTAATKIVQAIKKTNEFTFECWIKSMETEYDSDSRIVSLASNNDEVGFLLDQDFLIESDKQLLNYSVRMQTESTVSSGYPEFQPESYQSRINVQHLVYKRDKTGNEAIYLNGVKSSEGFRPSDLNVWDDNYFLRLGNEKDMNHSWKGSYYSVAFYNKGLSENEIMTNYNAGPCDEIVKEDLTFNMDITPNPVHDYALLTISPENLSDVTPETTIRILDVLGKPVSEEVIFNPNRVNVKTLDFTGYLAGIYFIQIISGKKQKSKKVIVSK